MASSQDRLARAILKAPFRAYAKHVIRIEAKDTTIQQFDLNEAQLIVDEEVERQLAEKRPVRVLILKGRQQGMSTYCQARVFHKTQTHSGTNALTVGHKLDATNELMHKYEVMVREMPEFLRPEVESQEKGRRMRFAPPKRSFIRADSAHKPDEVGRSGTFRVAHFTEIPQWKDADATIQAVMATIPPDAGTMVFAETTAKGVSDWFYRTWKSSMAALQRGEEPLFIPIFVPWYKTSEYQRAQREGEPGLDEAELARLRKHGLSEDQMFWYRDQEIALGERVAEEYPFTWEEAFLSAGLPFFRSNSMKHYREHTRKPNRMGVFKMSGKGKRAKARFVDQKMGPTHIFETRNPQHRYSVGVDFASGRSGDYSSIMIVNADTMRLVASHRSKMLPDDVLLEAYFLANYYEPSIIVPESNGIGQALVDRLVNQLKHPFVYVEKDGLKIRRSRGHRYGWTTSHRNRMGRLEELAHLIHTEQLEIPCKRTVDEMQSFVYSDADGQRAEADAGANDDMIMALMMSIGGLDQLPIDGSRIRTVTREPIISTDINY